MSIRERRGGTGNVGFYQQDFCPRQHKLMFTSKGDAKKAMNRLSKRSKLQGSRRMDVYRCPHCDHWHFGHVPSWKL